MMSGLVDEAVKLYKAEEVRLNQTIQQYKELIRSMKISVKISEEEVPVSIKDKEIDLKERQEIELLEQALKKALIVRNSFAVLMDPGTTCQEQSLSTPSLSKEAISDATKHARKPKQQRSSNDVKKHHQQGTRTLHAQVKTRPNISGKQLARESMPVPKNLQESKQKTVSQMGHCSKAPEQTVQSDQEAKVQWVPSPSMPSWQSQRVKNTRLWNKVLNTHFQPVPERDLFRKRLASTFPADWPSVHTATMEAELNLITQLALDLTHCYDAELRSHQTACEPGTSVECERQYESLLMLAGLEEMMTKVIKHASRLKKDWEKRLAWWHGSFCPLQSINRWPDPEHCLPSLLAYSSERDLVELEAERLNIDRLNLEIRLHQALCDTLEDLIPRAPTASQPSPTVLRGVYSLLAEGGVYFPSLVVDTEPAHV